MPRGQGCCNLGLPLPPIDTNGLEQQQQFTQITKHQRESGPASQYNDLTHCRSGLRRLITNLLGRNWSKWTKLEFKARDEYSGPPLRMIKYLFFLNFGAG